MRLALAALLLALSAPAVAGAKAEAEAGALQLDPARSQAEFSVRMRWLQKFTGRFERFAGELLTLPGGLRQVTVEVDVASLDFGGGGRLTQWALSEEFFDVARHPVIVFVSVPFAPSLVRDGGELRGELSLRGETRQVDLNLLAAACPAPGLDCPIRLRGQVSRRAFGIDAHPIAVLDRVGLSFDVRLRGEP